MAIQNKTRYAILGVLCMKPCSGYDIKKFCDKTISHFWNENFGHIYPVLKQLLDEQMIILSGDDAGSRRKIYCITEKGRDDFKEWLAQAPQMQPPRSELLLKLSFGNHMPYDKVTAMIREVKERNLLHLEQYRLLEQGYLNDEKAKKDSAYPFWLASLRLGIKNAEATSQWAEDTLQLLQTFEQNKKTEAVSQ